MSDAITRSGMYINRGKLKDIANGKISVGYSRVLLGRHYRFDNRSDTYGQMMTVQDPSRSTDLSAAFTFDFSAFIGSYVNVKFTSYNGISAAHKITAVTPTDSNMITDYIKETQMGEDGWSFIVNNSSTRLCVSFTIDPAITSPGEIVEPAITVYEKGGIEYRLMDLEKRVTALDVMGKQWQGKIWHGFGTSVSNINREGKYPPYLATLSGLTHVNFGSSGGTLTNQILSQIKGDSNLANADLITIEGFVNDWFYQSTLGEITDTTASTFYGAMYEAITYIRANSNATLVIITDTTGQLYNSADLRRTAIRNGKTQNDFIEATIKMCNYMDVPVIDAGRKSGISEETASLYLADQIHQTAKGAEQYARTIWSELKNIMPRIL